MLSQSLYIYHSMDEIEQVFASEKVLQKNLDPRLIEIIKCFAFEGFGGQRLYQKEKDHLEFFVLLKVKEYSEMHFSAEKVAVILKFVKEVLFVDFLHSVELPKSKACILQ